MKPLLLAVLLGATLSLSALAEGTDQTGNPATTEAAAKAAPRTVTVISDTLTYPGQLFGKPKMSVEWTSNKPAGKYLEELMKIGADAEIAAYADTTNGNRRFKIYTLREGDPGQYLAGSTADEGRERAEGARNFFMGLGQVAMMVATGGFYVEGNSSRTISIKADQVKDLPSGAKKILLTRIEGAAGVREALTVSYDDIDEDTLARINVEQGLARILKLKLPEPVATN